MQKPPGRKNDDDQGEDVEHAEKATGQKKDAKETEPTQTNIALKVL